MRELSMQEVDSVNGGNGFLIGVASGIVANIIYDNFDAVAAAAFPPYGLYKAIQNM